MHGKLYRAQIASRTKESVLKPQVYERVLLRAAVFDIETTSLTASGSMEYLICTSILPLDSEKVCTLSIRFKENRDDRRILTETVKELEKYEILIGHNIAAYDFNWLNSRLMYHNLPPMSKKWLYYDTYQAARRLAIKAHRKSLGFLIDFFRLPGVKTSVLPVSWGMISSPNETEFNEALGDIVYHCEQDVISNRMVFNALWPRDKGLRNLPASQKW